MLPEFLLATVITAAGAPSTQVNSLSVTKPRPLTLTPASMFALAELATRKSDLPTAEAIYRALESNPSVQIRNEARFRLAMLFVSQDRHTDGALLLRRVLDEEPNAQRVRLELAAILAIMGDEESARRELRAARAGGLPPEVVQQVDRFSAALRAQKPVGGSLQVALTSDSNANRATRSDKLGTIIGDFILNEDAKAHSARGLAIDGQAYRRVPLGGAQSLMIALSGSANLYQEKRFRDVVAGAKAGPELQLGRNRLNLSGRLHRRWFGGDLLSTSTGGQIDFSRPLAPVTQLRLSGSADRIRNHRNSLESGWSLAGSAAVETALSRRSGTGIAISSVREALRDPGYSTVRGQATLFGYYELGRMTMSASASLGRLISDRRLLLYPNKREEWLWRGTIGATLRQATFGGFAPTVQLTLERNRSSIELYDYRRTAVEFGVTRAF